VRLGVHLGPFYASTSTRRRRGKSSGGGWIAGFFGLVLLIGWPFLLGQNPNGGYHGWVWAIAVPWWILLALVLLLALVGKLTDTSATKDGGGRSDHPASSERPSHPGPAEVRDQLIAVTEIAVGKGKKRNSPAAEQLASVLRQLRKLSPSDAQLIRLAGLIPAAESIPVLVNATGLSLRTESARAMLDSLIASAERSPSSLLATG
jgi:hypothetical protein